MALRQLVSPEWVQTHVLGVGDASDWLRSRAMILPEAVSQTERQRFSRRLVKLADMLINLQIVPGFSNRITRMQTADVDATIADFEAAEMLYRSAVPFRFVDEQYRARDDYDIAATFGGLTVACEVKCKLQGTPLSERTILGALKKSQEQLPRDMPGIVFLKFPESWVPQPEAVVYLESALEDIFARTARISAVVGFFEQWFDKPWGNGSVVFWKLTRHNPRARVPLTQFGSLISSPLDETNWLTISKLFGSPAVLWRRAPVAIRDLV